MRYMTIRDFLRGGYQEIKAPIIVTSRGLPVFTVLPGARQDFHTPAQRATLAKGPPGPNPNGG